MKINLKKFKVSKKVVKGIGIIAVGLILLSGVMVNFGQEDEETTKAQKQSYEQVDEILELEKKEALIHSFDKIIPMKFKSEFYTIVAFPSDNGNYTVEMIFEGNTMQTEEGRNEIKNVVVNEMENHENVDGVIMALAFKGENIEVVEFENK